MSDRSTEGSETAKSGTDEQEGDRRLINEDKCAQQHNVQRVQARLLVDLTVIGGRNRLLPREIPQECGKSAEVIVVVQTSSNRKWRGLRQQRRTEHDVVPNDARIVLTKNWEKPCDKRNRAIKVKEE